MEKSQLLKLLEQLETLSSEALEYTFDPDRDLEEVGELYATMRLMAQELSVSIKTMEELLNKLMGDGQILTVADQGVAFEKSRGSQRVKWDHNTVRSVLVEKIIAAHTDPETGAIEAPVSQLINEAFDMTGLKWKITQLKKFGLNPNMYSEKKDGKVTYRLTTSATSTGDTEDGDDDAEDFI